MNYGRELVLQNLALKTINAGKGHDEVIYKDALQHELNKAGISLPREKCLKINNKDIILPDQNFADFVIQDKVILVTKAIDSLTDNP